MPPLKDALPQLRRIAESLGDTALCRQIDALNLEAPDMGDQLWLLLQCIDRLLTPEEGGGAVQVVNGNNNIVLRNIRASIITIIQQAPFQVPRELTKIPLVLCSVG
jgi:hypothetical protein